MRRSIARRLLFWFLVIALSPCAVLTAVTAQIASNALENSVREALVRTAAMKATELESYAMERIRDGRALSGEPDVIRAVREMGSIPGGTGTAEATAALRKAVGDNTSGVAGFLAHASRAFGYSHLLVIDATGLLEGYHLDASDQPAEAVARKFVEGLGKGRYVSARALLSPNLQEEIPAAKLQLKWQRLQRLTGDYVAIKQVLKAESTVDSKLVLVTTQFSRLTDSLFVILDSNNQIVGVDFPTEANGPAGGR